LTKMTDHSMMLRSLWIIAGQLACHTAQLTHH
jgi:hypothetical protein